MIAEIRQYISGIPSVFHSLIILCKILIKVRTLTIFPMENVWKKTSLETTKTSNFIRRLRVLEPNLVHPG